MQEPKNYENTKASGEVTPIELGGHKLVIKQVTETRSKSKISGGKEKGNKPMIVVLFDFDISDKQKGYFMDAFKSDIRPDKKWPFAGSKWIVTVDEDGNCSRGFKTFTSCIERSNPGFKTVFGDNFGAQFKGKKIGGVFGEVQYLNSKNEEKTGREIRWFCSSENSETASIPERLPLNDHDQKIADMALDKAADNAAGTSSDDFMHIPGGIDEEFPFN